MKTTYIDLNLLNQIVLTVKKQTNLEWFEKIPSTDISFLGIKYGKTNGINEGWGYYRLSTEELLRYHPNYEIDEVNKVVYEKPMVSLFLENKECFNQYFDTDEEAEEYALEINEVSGKNLYAINHN
jgi:hypothetical protein